MSRLFLQLSVQFILPALVLIDIFEQMKVKAAERLRRSEKVIKKKKKKKKMKRCGKRVRIERENLPVVSKTLQHLFDSCKRVFRGPGTVPSSIDVQSLCLILDGMKPEDVGLSRDLQFFKSKGKIDRDPRVTSATIYKSHQFELCIFFLPATAVIPLHNHPEMTVFSKLLLGTMHIKAYDWVHHCSTSPSKHTDRSGARLAKLKANRMFTAPCGTSVLYPTSGGNIHEFTAITPCAVLDIIGPPYSKDDGRDCTYYQEAKSHALLDVEEMRKAEGDGGSYGWLEEIENPKESEMDGIEYMGPRVDNSTL